MRILWIEDFGKITDAFSAVKNCFQDLLGDSVLDKWDRDEIDIQSNPKALLQFCQQNDALHEVILCRHYHDFVETMADYTLLQDIDVILIDINLSKGVDRAKDVPPAYKHEEGGFYIYNYLIREGFAYDNICFLTGEENTLKHFLGLCQRLSMPEPLHYVDKDEKTEYADLRAWLKERQVYAYLTLRRGIIEGCRYVLSQLESRPATEVIQFDQFLEQENANDMPDYLKIVQNFLPLRQPDDKQKRHIYKLFVRTLAHEWEAAMPSLIGQVDERQLQVFGWIMKNVRNWAAHKNIFENLTEKEVAFLFLINMRSMFQLNAILPFEKALLSLFDNQLSQEYMLSIIDEKRLNLAKSYSSLKRKVKSDKEDAVSFGGMLNNLVNSEKISQQEIGSRLLQMFWHGLSWVRIQNVTTSTDRFSGVENAGIWYTFQLHSYGKDKPDGFLFQLARHIYLDSLA